MRPGGGPTHEKYNSSGQHPCGVNAIHRSPAKHPIIPTRVEFKCPARKPALTLNPVPKMIGRLVFLGVAAANVVQGFSSKYLRCQTIDPAPASALTGCPKGTVYVSATDGRAKYQSVQDAVLAM